MLMAAAGDSVVGLTDFFKPKRFLAAEDEEWHLETWIWFLKHFGGLERLRKSPLVTASRDFFSPTDATGHARAEHIFDCVKKHARMENWPCTLLPQPESSPMRVGELLALKPLSGSRPLGTFGVENGGEVVITYDPAKTAEPLTLVATFAHELAHYRLAAVDDAIPGDEEMHEYATDMMTVFLGFGLFGANRAFNFSQHGGTYSQGWQTSGAGYLRERDWVFALAVFLNLREQPAFALNGLLKPHLYSDLKAAAKYLATHPPLSRNAPA